MRNIKKTKPLEEKREQLNEGARELISTQCDLIKELLLKKNRAYGNSALYPDNIFSEGDAVANLSARIDDKLARIKNVGINKSTMDTINDLAGYLILLKLAVLLKNEKND